MTASRTWKFQTAHPRLFTSSLAAWVHDGGARPAPGRDPGRLPGLFGSRCGGVVTVRVLVVEDEQLLADAIARGLRRESMAVDVAYDGTEAGERIGVNEYDVVVLDRDLPGMSGDELCRQVVGQGGATRVLMLTAAAEVAD